MNILERIQGLCEKKGINPSKLEKELDFGKGTLYKWDKSSPSIDKVSKVADYFKVTTDFLLFGFDRTRVINLIEAARCGRTIEKFSEDTGVEKEHLADLCAGTFIEPPSVGIIKMIMDDHGSQMLSDYYGLMEASGHMDHQTALELRLEEAKNNAAAFRQYVVSDKNDYDGPATDDERTAVKAFLEAYRKMKKGE